MSSDEERLLRAADVLEDSIDSIVAKMTAELLRLIAPYMPYWAEPYAAAWVPIMGQAKRLASTILNE